MSIKAANGRRGGLATLKKYGFVHFVLIGMKGGALGGRPSWQEGLEKARERSKEALRRAGGRQR